MSEAPFRIHISREVDGRMQRQAIDVTAASAEAARRKLAEQPAFKGAIILKTKRVKQ